MDPLEGPEELEGPDRRWAPGIGLVLLGLVVSAFANVLALGPGAGPALRALGVLVYIGGVVVSGSGIHRLLWAGRSTRPRWVRLLITALLTPPVFAASGILVGLLMTIFQARFNS